MLDVRATINRPENIKNLEYVGRRGRTRVIRTLINPNDPMSAGLTILTIADDMDRKYLPRPFFRWGLGGGKQG